MASCPSTNLIGNRCLTTPTPQDTQLARSQKFAEEMSFSAALFRHFSVKPVPDTGLIVVLSRLWLEMKKRRVTQKSKAERPWLSMHSQRQPDQPEMSDDEHQSEQ